jgi:hypothetical protein
MLRQKFAVLSVFLLDVPLIMPAHLCANECEQLEDPMLFAKKDGQHAIGLAGSLKDVHVVLCS